MKDVKRFCNGSSALKLQQQPSNIEIVTCKSCKFRMFHEDSDTESCNHVGNGKILTDGITENYRPCSNYSKKEKNTFAVNEDTSFLPF